MLKNNMESSCLTMERGSRRRLKACALTLCVHAAMLFWCIQKAPIGHFKKSTSVSTERLTTLILVPLLRAPIARLAASTHAQRPPPNAILRVGDRAVRVPVSAPAVLERPSLAHPEPETIPNGSARTVPIDAPSSWTFDLAAARSMARAVAREEKGDAGDVNSAAVALTNTSQQRLSRGIERARREDCRTKYADMGILAIAPLLIDGVSGTGCKLK
jgi:hypothetical protein